MSKRKDKKCEDEDYENEEDVEPKKAKTRGDPVVRLM